MHRTFIFIVLSIVLPARVFAGEKNESETSAPGPDGEEKATIEADGLMEMALDQSSFAAAGNVRIKAGRTLIEADRAMGWPVRSEAYVEGNVRITRPKEQFTCERAFVNWESREVVFEEFSVRSRDKSKPLTWYVATPLGMSMSDGTVIAKDATASNCDYAVPHQYLRVREIVIKPNNDIVVKGVTYYVRGVPAPFYLPAMIIPAGRPSFRTSFGHSSRLGTFGTLDTTLKLPVDFDANATVKLGYFSERGPGYGLGVDYKTPLITRGEAEYYTLPHDAGEDVEGQHMGEVHRYRAKWLHSMDSPAGWELDVELQKYSDAGFEREFFKSEYFNDKQPEDRVYLKYSHDDWAAFAEGKIRLNEYLDQTEHLPVAGVRSFSHPLGSGFLWTSNTEFGFLRRRLSEIRRLPTDTDATYNERREKWDAFQDLPPVTSDELMGADRTVFRLDTIQEVSRPFAFKMFKVEPFAGVRETFYDKTLDDDRSLWRSQFFYGSRLSTSMYEMYDVDSRLFNINGVRHIVTPDILYISKSDTWGVNRHELIQLDETDAVKEEDKVALRLRNQFQTRRNGKVVDFLDLSMETDAYPDKERDNAGEQFSNLRVDTRMRPMDGLKIFSLADYDFTGQNKGLSFFNVGSDVELSERWSASVGHTYERGYDTYGTFSVAYRLRPNWTAVVTNERDWKNHRSLDERVELVRDFHEFSLSVAFEDDQRTHDRTVSVNLAPKSVTMPPRPGSFVKKLVESRDDEE